MPHTVLSTVFARLWRFSSERKDHNSLGPAGWLSDLCLIILRDWNSSYKREAQTTEFHEKQKILIMTMVCKNITFDPE